VNESDYNAFVLDPNNSDHLLLGAQGVWQATFQQDPAKITWTEINNQIVDPDGKGKDLPAQVTAVAVAPGNSNIIYAATSDSKIWRIDLASGNGWQLASGGLPTPAATSENLTQSINIDPKNPNHVFINTNGTFSAAGRVWVTRDGGTTWKPIGGNIPATLRVNSLAVDWRFKIPLLFAATDRGVYLSVTGGPFWGVFGKNLPHTMVSDISLLPQSNRITVSTFGRGVWRANELAPGSLLFLLARFEHVIDASPFVDKVL
jgi:hypothetical protein